MKTKLEILGTGCARCHQLAENAEAAARSLGLDYELVKVTDIQEIRKRVMMTPALVVDGVVKVAGRIPSEAELTSWLATAAEKQV